MLRYTGPVACQGDEFSTYASRDSAFVLNSARTFSHAELSLIEGSAKTVDPLVARLLCFGPLSNADIAVLQTTTRTASERPADSILFHEDSSCDHVVVLLDGIACRYRMLPGGRRQILGYVLPGDLCDLHFLTVGAPDHSVSMLTLGQVATIGRAKMLDIVGSLPAIGRALTLAASVDHAILHQWLLNIGQRDATERLSHLLCEFVVRMGVVGHVHEDGSLPFGINQAALADTLGMSIVHVNRTLQSLRRAGLIQLHGRRLTIFDFHRLAALATFDPHYLHIRNAVR